MLSSPERPVNVIEPRTGWWHGNNNLGVSAPFAPDANNQQTILKMDENGHPQNWTIQLAITGLDPFDEASLRAIIDVGSGGTVQQIECDWMNGTKINVVANAINVLAAWDNVNPIEALNTKLSVTVGRYGSGQSVAQRSLFLPSGAGPESSLQVPAGGQVVIPLPQFARQIRVYPGNHVSADLALFFSADFKAMTSGRLSGVTSLGVLRGTELAQGLAVPVHAESRAFKMVNDTAGLVKANAIVDLF